MNLKISARVFKIGTVCVAASFMAPCGVLTAQDVPDLTKLKRLSIEEIMEIQIPTVHGASRHEQKITDAPSAVTIIPRDEIQAYGHRTLADILRSVRDFYISNDRNYSYIGVRGFNRPGDYGGRVLLLVDGHRVNDPSYDSAGNGYDFSVDVDMIERVEIIRGPGSSLYGNNAFFAVVDVITRKAADVNGAEISGQYGSFDTYKGRFTYGKTFANGASLLLSGSAYDSAGGDLYFKEFDQPENNRGIASGRDDERAYNFLATLKYGDFSLQTNYVWRRKDVPTGSFETAFNDSRYHTVDERWSTVLNYNRAFDNGIEARGSIYLDSYKYGGDYPYPVDPGTSSDGTIYRDQAEAHWWGGELQISKTVFNTHRLTLGGEYKDNSTIELTAFDVDPHFSYLALKTSARDVGVYLQDEWAITKKLALNAGLRYDNFEKFGSTVNPRLALIYHPWKDTTVKLLYGQAFRAPNAFEASYETATFRINPDLQPEQIQSYELVLEQTLSPQLRVSASAFHNRITDLISESYDATAEKFFFANGAEVETTGASLEFEARLKSGIRGRASYTLQETIDTQTGHELSNSPRHLAKLNLMVPLYKETIATGIELQYTSEVEGSRGNQVPGSVVVNWNLTTRELLKGLETSVGVYNLFDQDYAHPADAGHRQNSIQQDGRMFRLKFNYKF